MSQFRRLGMLKAVDPSLLLAAVGTVCFYGVVHLPSMHGSLLHRYTTEHFVEYVITALFAWGLADIALKLASFPRERVALRREWIAPKQGREPVSNASQLLEKVRRQPRWLQESKLAKRLTAALGFLTERGSAAGLDEHLEYLAEQDEDQTHANYSVIRFVMGVSPVLGFLGTVIHFGTALSGNSLDELADRLPQVVSEMGEAFNTTTVALAAAMTMTFALFVCERFERATLRAVDRLLSRELLNRFEVKDPAIVPFLSSLQAAHHETLVAVHQSIRAQTELWSQAVSTVFQHFEQRQQHELNSWQTALEVLQQRHESLDAHREQRLQQTLGMVDAKHAQQLDRIQHLLDRALAAREEFGMLAKSLDMIAQGEGKLIDQQRLLTTNLQVLRESQQLEDALHSMTAAMHLMTARHGLGPVREAA